MQRLGLAIVVVLGAVPAWAQTTAPVAASDVTVREVGVPAGVTLGVVGRTPGIPAILHALHATATSPLGTITVENPGTVALTHLQLAVTTTPVDGGPRRRELTLGVAIPAGTTVDVPLTGLETTARAWG